MQLFIPKMIIVFIMRGYQVQAIDTTGAGDAFIGAIIYCILESRHSECKDLFKEKGKIY